jgi:hypothetical protein
MAKAGAPSKRATRKKRNFRHQRESTDERGREFMGEDKSVLPAGTG